MNVLELFAGIGGISLGFDWSGVDVVGQVELDPFARRVLARHWPEVPRHDDVRTALDWWRSQSRPVVDIVAGGYPCQPESTAGRRRGTDDHRWLWPEFASIVDALRPTYVLGENVVGHRTQGLRFVLADLDQLGYTARAGIVSAAEVGAPHIRKRIFILAKRADAVPDTDRGARRDEHRRDGAPLGQGPAEPGDHGGAEPVADTDRAAGGSQARHAIWGARGTALGGRPQESGRCSDALADANGDWEQQPSGDQPAQRRRAGHGGPQAGAVGGVPDSDGQGLPAGWSDRGDDGPPSAEDEHWADPIRPSWWAAEPAVGRVAYGVPNRVDRLRTLGNAVVPRVAYAMVQLLLSDRWLTDETP